jgi:phosphatidate phosphatase APP1
MPGAFLKEFLHSAIAELERDIDRFDDLLAQGEGHERKVRVLAYAGYRNAEKARVKGRIVRYEKPLDAGEGFATRVRAMVEIYNSNELQGIEVQCEGYGQVAKVCSDEEGYFDFELPADAPLPETTRWEQVTLSTPGREAQQPAIKVPVMAPGANNNWGIISDIDDTVIETVLAFYPGLKFLLIGDNGQRDVTIYAKAVADFPGRVAAVFIRDVDGSCRSGPEGALLREIEARGVPTFCGAGFGDATALVERLGLDRPAEAASAVVAPAKS